MCLVVPINNKKTTDKKNNTKITDDRTCSADYTAFSAHSLPNAFPRLRRAYLQVSISYLSDRVRVSIPSGIVIIIIPIFSLIFLPAARFQVPAVTRHSARSRIRLILVLE